MSLDKNSTHAHGALGACVWCIFTSLPGWSFGYKCSQNSVVCSGIMC